MASNLIIAPTDKTIVDHLQRFHGLDIEGEWLHAADAWRLNAMHAEALSDRHDEQHEQEHWNEASDYHKHPDDD